MYLILFVTLAILYYYKKYQKYILICYKCYKAYVYLQDIEYIFSNKVCYMFLVIKYVTYF